MKFLQIGLGSMGKRRVRCLQALGHKDVVGFDPREDRRAEAQKLYGIRTVARADASAIAAADAVLISTPPDSHLEYIKACLKQRKPAFIEASVILKGLPGAARAARAGRVPMCPSCTLSFHPAIKLIRELVEGGKYGRFANFSYHSGQYLPDWHPWEKVKDFYVSRKETGGGREIVPFELTWLCEVFGLPVKVAACYGPTMDVGAAIDDTYALALKFRRGIGSLIVDVAARRAVRQLVINLERGQIKWNWEDKFLEVYDAKSGKLARRAFSLGKAAKGYNKNIAEDMYIDEIRAFVKAARREGAFPNTLEKDIEVLKVLYRAEGKVK